MTIPAPRTVLAHVVFWLSFLLAEVYLRVVHPAVNWSCRVLGYEEIDR